MTSSCGIIEPGAFRRVLGHYPTGVCVVTSDVQGAPVGMVVGSFTSISLSPPLVAFASDRESKTWRHIVEAGRFCVNVLANDQLWLCQRFSGRSEDRFESIAYRKSRRGMPIIDDVVAWIDCVVHAIHTAGDHHIVLGQVESIDTVREAPPLLFLRGSFGQFAPLP